MAESDEPRRKRPPAAIWEAQSQQIHFNQPIDPANSFIGPNTDIEEEEEEEDMQSQHLLVPLALALTLAVAVAVASKEAKQAKEAAQNELWRRLDAFAKHQFVYIGGREDRDPEALFSWRLYFARSTMRFTMRHSHLSSAQLGSQ